MRTVHPRARRTVRPDQARVQRGRFQIYVPKDPESPELGYPWLTRSGFTSTDEANDALQEAVRQRKQSEKLGDKVPTAGAYADEWAAALKLAASTIKGCQKIIRNHTRPQLVTILDAAIDDRHLTVNPVKKKRTVNAPSTSEVQAQKPSRCSHHTRSPAPR